MSTDRTRPEGLVTILVACCGQLDYTRLCVLSLLRFSRVPYEIVFLDSDSLDGTKEYLEGLAVSASVRIETIQVSGEADNAKRKEENIPVRGEYVVLMNNDVIVGQHWLTGLVRALKSEAGLGLVAPMSNNAAAALLVDPVPYSIDSHTGDAKDRNSALALVEQVNDFAKDWAERHRGQCFEVDQVSGGCVLLKREALQKIGLFPTRTPLGVFDLEAIGQRVRHAGFRVAGFKEIYVHNAACRGAVRR